MCDRLFPISQPCKLHWFFVSLPVSRVIGISLSICRLVHVLASVARICLRFFIEGFFGAVRTWTYTGIFLSDYSWHRQSIVCVFYFG